VNKYDDDDSTAIQYHTALQNTALVLFFWRIIVKWGLAQSPTCDCGQRQTMNHIVDMRPLTRFGGGLNLLHEADDDAVIWLESTATAALVKQLNCNFNCSKR